MKFQVTNKGDEGCIAHLARRVVLKKITVTKLMRSQYVFNAV